MSSRQKTNNSALKNISFELKELKNSLFEMAVNFDMNFGDFIATNFHVDQKVRKYDKCQIICKYLYEHF